MGSPVDRVVAFLNEQRGRALLLALAIVVVNGLVAVFVTRERYFYYWDFAAYWDKYEVLGARFATHPIKWLHEVVLSIRYSDYNDLPLLAVVPFHMLLGSGRLPYILLITNLYAISAAFSAALALRPLVGTAPGTLHSLAGLSIALMTTLLIPQFWSPVLFGYVDVVGVLVINVILFIYFTKAAGRHDTVWLVLLGFMLAGLVMLRRWYAFWVVAFFIAAAVDRSLPMFDRRQFSVRRYVDALWPIFIIGVVSLIPFLVVARPIATRMLKTDHASVYSAYKDSGTFVQFLTVVFNRFGVLITCVFLASVVECLSKKQLRRTAIFLSVNALAGAWLFSRTQDFSFHHYYLVVPTVAVFVSAWAVARYRARTTARARAWFIGGYAAALVVNFAVVFVPTADGYFGNVTTVLSSERHYPLVRSDVAELKRMLTVLQERIQTEQGTAYVLASSTILNDDILKHAGTSADGGCAICPNIEESGHVDRRDGLKPGLFRSKWIVVADPVQYHLRQDGQQVIGRPAEQILTGRGIGAFYSKLPYEFDLDGGVKAYIFNRTRRFDDQALKALSLEFLALYPDAPELFTPQAVTR